ncbi:MAG TPA: hypothetical protein VMB03_01435 [Bryobacteraceae bacterium]|nr:hypothetical protein [Bryobacteraceae bacterium]
MSAAAIATPPYSVDQEESLAGRMSRGVLPPGEALRHAIAIAAGLRDLHKQGLVYGTVTASQVLLVPSGAVLRNGGGLMQLGDCREDVKSFGAVLSEILRRSEGPSEFKTEIGQLASRCREESLEMRYVLTRLRLMRLRQNAPAKRKLILVRQTAKMPRFRLRVHMTLRWRPLVNLVAAALTGK